MKKRRPETYHEGANDERTAIKAKVWRMVKAPIHTLSCLDTLNELIEWIGQRDERYRKRRGGL